MKYYLYFIDLYYYKIIKLNHAEKRSIIKNIKHIKEHFNKLELSELMKQVSAAFLRYSFYCFRTKYVLVFICIFRHVYILLVVYFGLVAKNILKKYSIY